MILNKTFVQLAENMLLGFWLTFLGTLVLLDVALSSFIETFKQLLVSSVFVCLFIARHVAFLIDLRDFACLLTDKLLQITIALFNVFFYFKVNDLWIVNTNRTLKRLSSYNFINKVHRSWWQLNLCNDLCRVQSCVNILPCASVFAKLCSNSFNVIFIITICRSLLVKSGPCNCFFGLLRWTVDLLDVF